MRVLLHALNAFDHRRILAQTRCHARFKKTGHCSDVTFELIPLGTEIPMISSFLMQLFNINQHACTTPSTEPLYPCERHTLSGKGFSTRPPHKMPSHCINRNTRLPVFVSQERSIPLSGTYDRMSRVLLESRDWSSPTPSTLSSSACAFPASYRNVMLPCVKDEQVQEPAPQRRVWPGARYGRSHTSNAS